MIDNHTHSNEFCEPCDSGYRSYVCMFQGKPTPAREVVKKYLDSKGILLNDGWSFTNDEFYDGLMEVLKPYLKADTEVTTTASTDLNQAEGKDNE